MPITLNIADLTNFAITGLELPPPAPKPAYASSYDTEGSIASDEAHYENREITVSLRIYGTDTADLEANLNSLYNYVGQINREGGVLEYTSPNGTTCFFDLEREAAATVSHDHSYASNRRASVELRMMARPFWRGEEIQLGGTFSETTLPALVFTVAGPAGDVPALGRLVITDTESGGKDRWIVIVGGDSRWYSSAATNALFYQAEDLTPTGTSTKTGGASGASGAGSNVVRNTDLTTTYQAILRSEIDASNLALTHKGTFRVWGRIYRPTSNTGAMSVALEWAEGDYLQPTRNDPVSFAVDDREGLFWWVNLGTVHIDPKSTRWEFHLLAKSTAAGDEIDADCFLLVPTEVTYIELAGLARFQNPTSFSARDEFDQTAGALTGKTAPVGGVWAGAGDADDFSVETTGKTAQRTAVSDTSGVGRYVISGVAAFAAQAVQVDVKASVLVTAGNAQRFGLLARYTDTSNHVKVEVSPTTQTTADLVVRIVVAGSSTVRTVNGLPIAPNASYTVRFAVDAAGRHWVWYFPQGGNPGGPVFTGSDAALATGGTLASGKPGIYDELSSATASTRNFDNFLSFAHIPDGAIPSQQSLTLKHDSATREDSGGTFSTTISDRRGRYLKIPPGGPEARSTRLAILALPNDPYTMADAAAIYDLSAQLFVTPRGLVVPEA